jgi:hypothetical protein
MKPPGILTKNVIRHRKNLKALVARLEKKPFDYLPERSVECLNQFFSGYQIFGPQLWSDFGKKARGFEELFEMITEPGCRTIRRRAKRPKEIILIPETYWWRSPSRNRS